MEPLLRFAKHFVDEINHLEELQARVRRLALAEAAILPLVPGVATSPSAALPASSGKEASSGQHGVDEASAAEDLVARSLKNTHMPPALDSEPDHGDDSGDDADDEESLFGVFLESPPQDDEEIVAEMKEMRLALEYLRGVLSASKAQKASTSKDAAEKADDDKGVPAKDRIVDDDDDDFVYLESDEDEDETQDISRSCLDLLNELDYIVLPDVGVDLFRAEMEFMLLGDKDCAVNGGSAASSSARERSKWQLLSEKFYDEDKKAFKEVDLDNWRREVVQTCGDLFKDVSRRLHRLRNGC